MSNVEIKDLLGLAQPTTKLVEIVSNAIGVVYEPKRIKKKADAEAYRLATITKVAKETDFLGEIEIVDGKILIDNRKIDNGEMKALINNEFKRLLSEKENIIKIADYAYNELINSNDEIKEEIDEDWKNNFFNKGKQIYSEDLQFIFGKILAGEIKQPGTFSKRLLNILSNLSQKEAFIFTKIAKYTLKTNTNTIIISDESILKDLDIKLEEILLLEEAGLINSNALTISGLNLYEYKNYLINFFEEKPHLNVYFLTKAGSELESIIDCDINKELLKKIKDKYGIKKMSYGKIISKELIDHQVEYTFENTKEII